MGRRGVGVRRGANSFRLLKRLQALGALGELRAGSGRQRRRESGLPDDSHHERHADRGPARSGRWAWSISRSTRTIRTTSPLARRKARPPSSASRSSSKKRRPGARPAQGHMAARVRGDGHSRRDCGCRLFRRGAGPQELPAGSDFSALFGPSAKSIPRSRPARARPAMRTRDSHRPSIRRHADRTRRVA